MTPSFVTGKLEVVCEATPFTSESGTNKDNSNDTAAADRAAVVPLLRRGRMAFRMLRANGAICAINLADTMAVAAAVFRA